MDSGDTAFEWTAEETHRQYSACLDSYIHAVKSIKDEVIRLLSSTSLNNYEVSGRHKDPVSLFVKQGKPSKKSTGTVRYQNPWTDCSDLLGLRVIVQLASDKNKVAEAISNSNSFIVLEVDDKEQSRNFNELSYGGLHLDLLCKGIITPLSDYVRCELQIRTLAEHTWAETEHEFIYKGPSGIPKNTQRQFARVLALVELLDLELDRGVKSVSELPSYSRLKLSRTISIVSKSVDWSQGSHELTIQNIEEICAFMPLEPTEMERLVQNYSSNNRAQLDRIKRSIGPDSERFDIRFHALAAQPECILIAALLERNPMQVSTAMHSSDLLPQIASIARVLGLGRSFV